MSLQLNQEIEKISKTLTSSTGSDLSNFASQVKTGLQGVKSSITATSQGLAHDWRDTVSARTVNIMQTVGSKIDKQQNSADTISSAGSAVTSLKTKADAYVQAYNNYKSSQYYQDSPPSDCEDKDAWRANKIQAENKVKEAEEAAISAKAAVISCFSSSSSSSGGGISGDLSVTTLSGAELTEFCNKNFIDKNRVTVKKTTVEINGGTYDLYYVYDNNMANKEFENLAFEQYVEDSIHSLEKIDPNGDIMKNIDSTYLIFEQTYACDTGHRQFQMDGIAQAWFYSPNNAVTSWFPQYSYYEYGVGSIIHEFGHVVDSAIGYHELDDHLIYQTRDIDKVHWDSLIREEADSFKEAGIPGLCGSYDKEVYLESETEYLAECFYAYYYSDASRAAFKEAAPKTYAEVEKIIKKVQTMG